MKRVFLVSFISLAACTAPTGGDMDLLSLSFEAGHSIRKPDLIVARSSPQYLDWQANNKPQEHYRSGRYTVVFGRLGERGDVWPLAVYLGAPPQPETNFVLLPWPCKVMVAVVDSDRNPVVGALLTIDMPNIPPMSRTTDTNGEAEFFPVAEGNVAVRVGTHGPIGLRVTPSSPLRLRILAEDGTLIE